jgi:hypothetical protein
VSKKATPRTWAVIQRLRGYMTKKEIMSQNRIDQPDIEFGVLSFEFWVSSCKVIRLEVEG